ncbi:MAG TPA: RNA methyltransferase [Leptolyngbyaceae cyanobacterium M65_K2018_010]|nr:RNA methyltransferase [Leptolyngbyaceae cyanobacterium M65_K2018_010]
MLTSLQNPLVKEIRKLHQAKVRRQRGQFLLEGTHLIQEALALGYPLTVACHTQAWAQRYPDLATTLQEHTPQIETVSEAVLEAMATTVHPDGIIAIAPQRRLAHPPTIRGIGVFLDGIQDPGNLGTIIRTAAATGADGLWLSPSSVAPDHPKVLRASAGQWFRLPIEVRADVEGLVQGWRQAGVQLVATQPGIGQDYWEADLTGPTVLMLGNEGTGLSDCWQQQATVTVTIPMQAGVESLNVAICAALLLYEAKRQRG